MRIVRGRWSGSRSSVSSKRRLFVLLLALVVLVSIQNTLALPPGFRDEGVVSDKQTVGFNFVPSIEKASNSDWLLLTTRKKGQIVAVLEPERPDYQSESVIVLDIEDQVCTEGERGVFQVLAHPNFVENQYVYVFFTYDKHGGCKFSATEGPVNAVARYKLRGNGYNTEDNPLRMVDQEIIFMTNPLPSKVHNGGDMKFGNDGNLYVTLGNGGMSNEHGNAQKANTLLGSIVRITEKGGIPSDNPFQEANDKSCGQEGLILDPESGGRCSEIWATGFRNPFRFALDPNTNIEKNSTNSDGSSAIASTRFYINDVGGSFFEEVDLVTDQSGGLNYGYREREGPCSRMSNADCTPDDRYVDPVYWYEHVNRTDACMTGGAFVPNGIWPKAYDNKYLVADFIFRTISLLGEDSSKLCRDCTPPVPGFSKENFFDLSDSGQPLQLTFGPYKDSQALYYSLWGPEEEFSVRRIIYQGGNSGNANNDNNEDKNNADESNVDDEEEDEGKQTTEKDIETADDNDKAPSDNTDENEGGEEEEQKEKVDDKPPPVVVESVNSAPDAKILIDGAIVSKGQNYRIDEVLVFDASNSTDQDGDKLVYSWNFGDGTGSTKVVQTHAYEKPGEYRVKLAVQDVHGFTDATSRLITIGNLPQPSIIFPYDNYLFAVGDDLTLFGHAVDGDENDLENSHLTWEVRQVHNTHYHPFLDPTIGNMIKIPPAPSPEDFQASTNSFLRILLTATDPKTNLTGTVVRDILPKTKKLYFGTDPPGLQLTLDGFDIKTSDEADTPLEVVTWIHHNFTIDVGDQGDLVFDSWSNGIKERFSREMILDEKEEKLNSSNGSNISISNNQGERVISGERTIIKTARFVARSEIIKESEDSSDEGLADEGSNSTNEENIDEGLADEDITNEENIDEGSANEENIDKGLADEDSTNEENIDEGLANKDSTNEENINEGSANEDNIDEGLADEDSTNEENIDEDSVNEGIADEDSTDEENIDEAITDEGSADEDITDESSADEYGTVEDNGSNGSADEDSGSESESMGLEESPQKRESGFLRNGVKDSSLPRRKRGGGILSGISFDLSYLDRWESNPDPDP